MKKNPMDKNNLGDNLPSRNNTKGENPKITRASGAPVENNQDSMTAGRRGPIVFEDTWLFEKMLILIEKLFLKEECTQKVQELLEHLQLQMI
ncbi:hypothetical protein [Anaerococcus obesiensis]|uniref:hypothetical protein n=1 Tax=Anaerococcus obesiensis TaxID=1287640 RepID=UPI002D8081A7|nr:hypothetical protein [Anaerococcus obesiensis]